MSADKKTNKEKLPLSEKDNSRAKGQEQRDDNNREKDKKARRVNYIVKDLPIY